MRSGTGRRAGVGRGFHNGGQTWVSGDVWVCVVTLNRAGARLWGGVRQHEGAQYADGLVDKGRDSAYR
jgi:hypothetical protein